MKGRPDSTSSFGRKVRQCLCDFFYAVCKMILAVIFRVLFRVRVVGYEHASSHRGPLLVVANHISEWDPFFMGSCLPWQVHWLGKVELFELLGGRMAHLLRILHCFPVDRQKADLGAIKEIVRRLKSGRPVVVFAEGGIRCDETSLLGSAPQLKEGAAIAAIHAGCPILPILLNGTVSLYMRRNWILFRRRMLEVVIGPVFRFESRDRAGVTAEILRHQLALKPLLKQREIC